MKEKELILANRLGLHARAAAKLARLAMNYECEVWLGSNDCGSMVDAKSIVSLMTLGASCGTRVLCRVSGPDEAQALQAIESLVGGRFGEGA